MTRARAWQAAAIGLVVLSGWGGAEAPESAADLIRAGVRLHDEGRYAEAIETYRKALALEPENLEGNYELAMSLMSAGRFDECIQVGRRQLEKAGRLKAAYYSTMASCIDSAGKPKEAAKLFDDALQEFPEDYSLLLNAGITRLRLGEPETAKELLKRAVGRAPTRASAHLFLGLAFDRTRHPVPSVLAYLRFLSLEPTSARTGQAAARVAEILDRSLSKTGEKEYTIEVDPSSPKDEGDYGSAELFVSMSAAVVTTEEWEAKPAGEKLVYRIDSLLEGVLEVHEKGQANDFTRATYGPFLGELRGSGLLQAFVYRCFSSLGSAEMKEWVNSHPEKLTQLDDFLRRQAPR